MWRLGSLVLFAACGRVSFDPTFDPNCIGVYNEPFASGSGTVDDPYLICTAEQLARIGDDPRYLAAAFRVGADLDLRDVPAFPMIGSSDAPYTGTFDGGGRTIRGLAVSGEQAGLFANVDGATIKDVFLTDVDVTGISVAGSLVGYGYKSVIVNCHVQPPAEIRGTGATADAGGLVGRFEDELTLNQRAVLIYTSAHANVTSSYIAGGLVGRTTAVTVEQSFAIGTVTGTYQVGGIVGDCFSSSSVLQRAIGESWSDAVVVGGRWAGGLVGYSNGFCNVASSYAKGTVTGETVGGIAGLKNTLPTFRHSYTIATVDGTVAEGAVVGQLGSEEPDDFIGILFSSELTGLPALATGTPMPELRDATLDELRAPDTFLDAGWVLDGVWELDPARNDGFPVLAWQ